MGATRQPACGVRRIGSSPFAASRANRTAESMPFVFKDEGWAPRRWGLEERDRSFPAGVALDAGVKG
jgi:hypothetical protein